MYDHHSASQTERYAPSVRGIHNKTFPLANAYGPSDTEILPQIETNNTEPKEGSHKREIANVACNKREEEKEIQSTAARNNYTLTQYLNCCKQNYHISLWIR